MSGERTSDERLGAYVDGELGVEDAAAVAAAIARDRELAARVAVLSRLKATVARTPRAPAGALSRARRPPARRVAAAAAVALLVAASVLALRQATVSMPLDDAVAAGRALHLAWVQEGIRDVAARERVRASLRAVGVVDADLPDLSAAGLSFSHVRPAVDGASLHVGYAGSRGCMVSLVVFADGAAFPAGLEKREVSGRDAYVWREGRGGYMLMADRMAPGRLALVARTVHEAVRRRAPLGPEGTRLLIASREQMPPCTA